MVEIREVTFKDVFGAPGWTEWVDEYKEELSTADIPAAFQPDFYLPLEEKGALTGVAAFDEGVLVGLAGCVVERSGHHPYPIVMLNSLYLRKEWRRGALGLRILARLQKLVASLGAPGFTTTSAPGTSYDDLCKRLGMTHVNNLWWCKV